MRMKTAPAIIAFFATLALAAPVAHVPDGVNKAAVIRSENGEDEPMAGAGVSSLPHQSI